MNQWAYLVSVSQLELELELGRWLLNISRRLHELNFIGSSSYQFKFDKKQSYLLMSFCYS